MGPALGSRRTLFLKGYKMENPIKEFQQQLTDVGEGYSAASNAVFVSLAVLSIAISAFYLLRKLGVRLLRSAGDSQYASSNDKKGWSYWR